MNESISFLCRDDTVTEFMLEDAGDRPPDWRWQQFCQICDGSMQADSCRDEIITKVMIPVLNREPITESDIGKSLLIAAQLKRHDYGRWIEVYLLGGADYERTAEKIRQPIMPIAMYALVFFDVKSRLDDAEKIKEIVFRPLFHEAIKTEEDLRFIDKVISYNYGSEFVFDSQDKKLDYMRMTRIGNKCMERELDLHKALTELGLTGKDQMQSRLDLLLEYLPNACTGLNPNKPTEDKYYKKQIKLYRRLANLLPKKRPQRKEKSKDKKPKSPQKTQNTEKIIQNQSTSRCLN